MSLPGTVYRMYDADGSLLYIGCSGNPPTRFQDHRWNSPWYWDVTRIEMEHFESRARAFDVEREAIRAEGPLYNVACKRPNGDKTEVAA